MSATDTIDVAALVERLTNLVGTQIEEDLEYIQAADAAMTDAVNALVLQADTLAQLHDGRRAILPHTVEHAENLYAVAVAALKSFGRDPETAIQSQADALAEARRNSDIAFRAAIDSGEALENAQEELATMREALEPFAAEARSRAKLALGPDIDDWPIGGSSLTLGDLRRAEAAYASAGGSNAE